MSHLNFDFVMVYVIHKILVLLKNHLSYLKDNIFECILRSITDFFFFKKKKILFFVTSYNGKNN